MSKAMKVSDRVYALAKSRADADDRTMTEALDRLLFPPDDLNEPQAYGAAAQRLISERPNERKRKR